LSAVTRYPLVLTGILLLGIFLWRHRQKLTSKESLAIVFSYVIIMIFLALPLLALSFCLWRFRERSGHEGDAVDWW